MQNHLDLFGLSLVSLKNVLNGHSNFHLPHSSHVLSFLQSPHPFPLDHSLHLSHCKVYQPEVQATSKNKILQTRILVLATTRAEMVQ